MRPSILCRERLDRILDILERKGGSETLRQFERRYSVWRWEVEAAAALGWITIERRKPPIGRPSLIVCKISESEAAKVPPSRRMIGKTISIRHENFAMRSVLTALRGGGCAFLNRQGFGGFKTYTQVYQESFPAAKSKAGAAASMSRLLHNPDVRAVRAWYYSKVEGVVPRDEAIPNTAAAIWQRLRELGSHRVR